MENTDQNQTICSLCDKPIKLLGIERKIICNHNVKQDLDGIRDVTYELHINEFKEDEHLKCRVKLAKYYLAGLRSRLLSLDKFVVTNNNKTAYNCIESIKNMDYEKMRRYGIYLYGQPGTGKTHLLTRLCCLLIDRGVYCQNITWANTSSILTKIRSSFGKKYGYEEKTEQEIVLEELKNRYLFLDDLGTENATEWAKEILYEVINYRYEQILPTFISSNLSPKELASRLGDKFTSRIIEMCQSVRIEGEDWRLRNANKRNQGIEINETTIPVFSYQMADWDNDPKYKKVVM